MRITIEIVSTSPEFDQPSCVEVIQLLDKLACIVADAGLPPDDQPSDLHVKGVKVGTVKFED